MVNRVTLTGFLGADPDTRAMPSGESVSNVRLATTERYRDRSSGTAHETTEWHRAVFYGRLADVAKQYLSKGSRVYVEGRLHTRKWKSDDNQDRYTTEVIVSHLEMLGGARQGDGIAPRTDDASSNGLDEWAHDYDRAATEAAHTN